MQFVVEFLRQEVNKKKMLTFNFQEDNIHYIQALSLGEVTVLKEHFYSYDA